MRSFPTISVIIPTRNEEAHLAGAIHSAKVRSDIEVIVADGCSTDSTVEVGRSCGSTVLSCPTGRARQMNAGAAVARGDILLFLHADSRLPPDFPQHVHRILAKPETAAGAFNLRIEPQNSVMRLHAVTTNLRSRLLQAPYGDQAIFLSRKTFGRVGGLPDMPIMEDLEFTRKLRRIGHIRIANASVTTSGRRWMRHGAWRMSVLNQVLIVSYYLGIDPKLLLRWRESGIIWPQRSLLLGRPDPIDPSLVIRGHLGNV